MKKVRLYIGILIVTITAAIFVSENLLGIDLLEIFNPDTTAPIIDISDVEDSIQKDGIIDLTVITCDDDRDSECEVSISGSTDTTTLGTKVITVTATDTKGNISEVYLSIEVVDVDDVVDGIDTTIYVPVGYYDGIDSLTGEALKNALNDIITNHTEFPYTDKDLDDMDVWKMLRAGDEDPDNSNNVLLFYSDFSWPKECQDTNTSLLPDICFVNSDRDEEYTEWNREHIWSKSHGDFADEDGYAFEDSFGGYPLGAHTDAHHLVAAERSMNSIKNNRFFDDCHDGVNDDNLVDRGAGNYTCGDWYFEPRDDMKGDVARMLFYMATRYEGEDGDFVDLELTTDLYLYEDLATAIKNSKLPYYESLEVLLRWHIEDPVDEWELERNEAIFQFQGNRNPFIDHPELVALVWGTTENPTEYVSTTAE
ncbi:Extracellular ribonuclease precursor [Candidatus Izimaplasma bacterium HR1]|jgi:endonuclease I|uniref:endonuclease n=1 Tax=Candidatus Izimoplasma sp. HR1 TaxID=1541959 RepID=UPI0004F7751D|nr:Extracellular ribonuclease precursor [Candidatus Izimaplasma bacterium HR1]